MIEVERGVREVCVEALLFLKERSLNDNIRVGDVIGYFHEILSIVRETEDDKR